MLSFSSPHPFFPSCGQLRLSHMLGVISLWPLITECLEGGEQHKLKRWSDGGGGTRRSISERRHRIPSSHGTLIIWGLLTRHQLLKLIVSLQSIRPHQAADTLSFLSTHSLAHRVSLIFFFLTQLIFICRALYIQPQLAQAAIYNTIKKSNINQTIKAIKQMRFYAASKDKE